MVRVSEVNVMLPGDAGMPNKNAAGTEEGAWSTAAGRGDTDEGAA